MDVLLKVLGNQATWTIILALLGAIAARYLKQYRKNTMVLALAVLADEVTDVLRSHYKTDWSRKLDEAVDMLISRAKLATGKTISREAAVRVMMPRLQER